MHFEPPPRFELLRQIGAGGMGVVFEAVDRQIGRHVALKTLRDLDPQLLYRFKQEFRAMQGVEHPNVVRLGELIEHDGFWMFSMELIDGVDILEYIGRHPLEEPGSDGEVRHYGGRCDVDRLRDALAQLVDGLAALHEAGKIHRDVKPSNVMVTEDGRVVLLDFGVATAEGGPDAEHRDTRDDEIVGSIIYAAPEQAAKRAATPAVDFYSVGAIAYQALTGRPPFEGPPIRVLAHKQFKTPPPPSQVADGVPADLDELCRDLLAIKPDERPGPGDILRRLGVPVRRKTPRRNHVPLPGRVRERAALVDLLTEGLGVSGQVVEIVGEGGFGKSALVEGALADLAATREGTRVLTGRCHARETVPFRAFDGIVDGLSRVLRRMTPAERLAVLPVDAALLTRLFPVLLRIGEVARLRAPEVEDAAERRSRAFGALRDLLAELADQGPLVLAVEDFHWADTDSVVLLQSLLRAPAPPLALILTTTEPVDPALRPEAVPWHRIELGPLSSDEASAFARALCRETGLDEQHAAPLAEEAGGHPLLIAEMVRGVAELGVDAAQGLGLDDVVRARVEAQDSKSRVVLGLLAISPAPLGPRALGLAAGLEPGQLADVLDGLDAAHLIKRASGRVRLSHARLAEATARLLRPESVPNLHGRLADALVDELRDDEALSGQLLEHLVGARRTDQAAELALQVGKRAEAQMAFDQAAAIYRKALEAGEHDRPTRYALLSRLAAVLSTSGDANAPAAHGRAAENTDGIARAEHLRRQAELLLAQGELAGGLDALRQVARTLDLRWPRSPKTAILSTIWRRLLTAPRVGGWQKRLSEGPFDERELLRIDVCRSAAIGLAFVDHGRAAAFESLGLKLALKLGEPARLCRAIAVEAAFRALTGRKGVERAHALLVEVEEAGRELKDPYSQAVLKGIEGVVAFYSGRFGAALERLEAAEPLLGDGAAGSWSEISTGRGVQLFALRYMGRLGELDARCQRFLEDASERDDRLSNATFRRYCNIAWLARDDTESARASLDAVHWTPMPEVGHDLQSWYELWSRAEIATYSSDQHAARGLLEAIARHRKAVFARAIHTVRSETAFIEGRLGLVAGVPGVARKAAARLDKENLGYARAWGRILTACADAQVGHRPDPAALVRLAADADAVELELCAAALRMAAGDDHGEAEMLALGAVNPERMARSVLPGLV